MKRTGLNTWGSDILLMNPSLAIDSPKCLLLVAFNVLWSIQLFSKTGNLSSSLHAWAKNELRNCFPGRRDEKLTGLFHIIEQKCRKSTGAVNKKKQDKPWQWFVDNLLIPYCGTSDIYLL